MQEPLNNALKEVMLRFRSFFTDHMSDDQVPLRYRHDFQVPLVMVMGYTYGVRLLSNDEKNEPGENGLALEVSANVYDDEFDLEHFKSKIEKVHQPPALKKTIAGFMSHSEVMDLQGNGTPSFISSFHYELERDIELVEKEKQNASKTTGRFVDRILRMKYRIRHDDVVRFLEDPRLFSSAVYLYCLRTFVLAYYQSRSFLARGAQGQIEIRPRPSPHANPRPPSQEHLDTIGGK